MAQEFRATLAAPAAVSRLQATHSRTGRRRALPRRSWRWRELNSLPRSRSTASIVLLESISPDRRAQRRRFGEFPNKLQGLIEVAMQISMVRIAALLLSAASAGCAHFSRDGGFGVVAQDTRAHLGKDVLWPRTDGERARSGARVAELLTLPLSMDDAVQVALLNNRQLQASFEELGISEADLVQSGRLPNPRFDFRHAGAAGQYDIEETVSLNVVSLLTMSYRHDTQQRRFEQTQSFIEERILELAKQTREAYIAAVAARESVSYHEQVSAAAAAGAELSRRMVAAGNWNRTEQAREQAFEVDAQQALSRARLTETASREKLIRLLGLPSAAGTDILPRLAERLPELPPSVEALPDVEQAVLENRVDLQILRLKLDELARSLDLTRSTRFVNVLEAGPTRVKQGAARDGYESGFVFSFEVPIFDSGAARVRRAESIYAQAIERFAQAAIDARSQIRQSYANYQTAFDLAVRQRDEVLPLRKSLADQSLLRYNASLISIFDLLSSARDQAAGADGYIQSARDFWLAKSQFDASLLGDSP
jgi:outer membrane protein TolC